jgi:NADPH:quinone reductase-like Zn-dependent oxidoreductase
MGVQHLQVCVTHVLLTMLFWLDGEILMQLRYKITGIVFILATLGVSVFAVMISHNSACEPAAALSGDAVTMKAIVYRCYGSPDVLELETIEKPTPGNNEVLVKIKAAAVNPLDWHFMRGSPYIMRLGTGLGKPREIRLGVDFAGTVEAVGKDVTRFKPGDEVFGGKTGAFAGYVTIAEDRGLVIKPPKLSFEQAASVPIAAITALQAVRDRGQLKAGQKVLVNGASGGVGTYAVQIAKLFGAEVTGVCSERNAAMVRSIGADHVIDYTREDYTQSEQHYDLIIDMVGNHSLSENRQVMTPEGIFVIIGGGKGNWIGPLLAPVKALIYSPFVGQQFGMMIGKMLKEDLATLAGYLQAGQITPVIDRRYPLSEVPAAIRYSEEGHARGKIIINLD